MKKFKRIFALALALMLILSVFSFGYAAETAVEEGMGRIVDGYDPIPLLVIKVNFEVDGIEGDCYEIMNDAGERTHAYNKKLKNTAQYGEQYCYSPDSYWNKICFGDELGALNHYYKYISNDQFYWIPVEETCATPNDGVITVTVNAKHPGSNDGGDLSDGGERKLAIQAADEFVDFSKYDKNKDGAIDFTELSICYVYGGYEASYSIDSSVQYTYPTHAHVSNISFGGLKLDGVAVYKDSQRYVRVGEYAGGMGDKRWTRMGKLAHELGHVLNAKDLYTSSSGWVGGCGELSLMGGGSGGKNGDASAPTVLDPYYKVLYGFAKETVAASGTNEYTLYSHESAKGDFNVIRINTPNPNEYYLIENRSHSESGYDNNTLNGNMQGILIWHIDENIINAYARPNNASEGHAAGFTVITPLNNIQDSEENSTWSSISKLNVFVAGPEAQYKFPVSDPAKNPGTWYTSMTEEEAAMCNIKIEFLTEPGDEMVVRISGAADLPVEVYTGAYDTTQTEMTVKASVSDYNGASVTSCKIYLADNKNFDNASVKDLAVNATGEYSATFTGLTADKEYFYKVEMDTTHGVMTTNSSSSYTKPVPVEKTKAKITLIINSDLYKTTNVSVKKGESLKISFPMTKKGYTFEGWYLDEALTQKYEIAPLESVDDFTLYAKWVEDVKETTPPPTQTTGTTADPTTPPPAEPPADNNGAGLVIVIAVVAVVVIGGAVAAILVINKKKTK